MGFFDTDKHSEQHQEHDNAYNRNNHSGLFNFEGGSGTLAILLIAALTAIPVFICMWRWVKRDCIKTQGPVSLWHMPDTSLSERRSGSSASTPGRGPRPSELGTGMSGTSAPSSGALQGPWSTNLNAPVIPPSGKALTKKGTQRRGCQQG